MSKDGGILDEVTWDRTMDSKCYDTKSSDWRMVSATHARGTTSEEWNEIDQNGSNIWRFQMYFPNRPESVYNIPCWERYGEPDWRPYPANFQYSVEIGYNEDPSQLYFRDNMPEDGDGDSDNAELDLVLDILGGVGGFYTGVGTAVVKYLIDNGWFSSGVNFSSSSSSDRYEWDIPLRGGYDDLPHEESKARSAEVKCRVRNEYASGTHDVSVTQSYTFNYRSTEDPYGVCDYSDCSFTYTKKTATTKIHEPSFEAI